MKYSAKQSYERMNRDHEEFIAKAADRPKKVNKERGDFSKTDKESAQNKRF